MSDDNSTPPSASAASKRKQSRKKLTPEQRIARLEQQLARARTEQRETSRKLKTRSKIILGGTLLSLLKDMDPEKRDRWCQKLISLMSERDLHDVASSGLLTFSDEPDNTSDTGNSGTGSDSSETGEKSGD